MELFQNIEQRQSDWEDTIIVSMIEIYNEKVRDLLSDTIRDVDPKLTGVVDLAVTNLTEVNEVLNCV